MTLNIMLNRIVIVYIILIETTAYKYDILFKNERIFSPCDFPNVTFLEEYVDFSNFNFEFLSNGSLYVHGWLTTIKDLDGENNQYSLEIFKKSRDSWVNTIYNLFRPDVCKSIFDPIEFWHKYVEKIPPENQTCPLKKGQRFDIDDATDLTLTVPDPRFAGEYKLQSLIRLPEINEVVCTNAFVEIYRH